MHCTRLTATTPLLFFFFFFALPYFPCARTMCARRHRCGCSSLSDPFQYQQYVDYPTDGAATPPSAFSSANFSGGEVVVHGPGVLRLKFAQEGACWVEFDSETYAASGAKLDISISENALPGECYRETPVQHNNSATFRVETNNQLYEGIYYAIINVTDAGDRQVFSV